MRRPTTLVRALVALSLAALLVAQPGTASAKPDRLELSTDGRVWQTRLTEPLFSGLGPIVPLDEATSSFEVRNSSKVPARTTVEVLAPTGDRELVEHLRVSTQMGAIRGSNSLAGVSDRRCKTVVTGPTLLPGETQKVGVGLAFEDVTGRTAQSSLAGVNLRVTLRQVSPAGVVTVCGVQAEAEPFDPCEAGVVALAGQAAACPDVVAGVERERTTSGGVQPMLPATGAPDVGELVLVGVGAIVLGSSLVLLRRRSNTSSSRSSASPEPVASTNTGGEPGTSAAAT